MKLSGKLNFWLAAIGFGILAAQPALAAECPGNPDALGTSRTLVVDPRQHPRIGTMQYQETLPLEDHEVVLTFDDGPLPRNSDQVLKILASQCVKATFFLVGRMAQVFPDGVRKLRAAGHTIGTHTQDHPLTMNRMPIERARQQIDDGIASVTAALGGDTSALAPFFRIPGLMRAEAVENYLASRGIQTWSADFPADDWHPISPARVYDLAIKRLEAKGKGILLLHDIQARTVAALPHILHELKARGYRIVQVVPATPERPATPTEPQQWLLHAPTEDVATSHWPKVPGFAYTATDHLPVPALSESVWSDGAPVWFANFSRGPQGPLPRHAAAWLQPQPMDGSTAARLPIADSTVFEVQESPRTHWIAFAPPRHVAEAEAPLREAGAASRRAPGARSAGRAHGRHVAGKPAVRDTTQQAAGTPRGRQKHLAQNKKGSV